MIKITKFFIPMINLIFHFWKRTPLFTKYHL